MNNSIPSWTCESIIKNSLIDPNDFDSIYFVSNFTPKGKQAFSSSLYCELNSLPASTEAAKMQDHYIQTGFWKGYLRTCNDIIDPYDYNLWFHKGRHIQALIGWTSLLGKTTRNQNVKERITEVLDYLHDSVVFSQISDIVSGDISHIKLFLSGMTTIKEADFYPISKYLIVLSHLLLSLRRYAFWEDSKDLIASVSDILKEPALTQGSEVQILQEYKQYLGSIDKMPSRGRVSLHPDNFIPIVFKTCSALLSMGYTGIRLSQPSNTVSVPWARYANERDPSSGIRTSFVNYKNREPVAIRVDNALVTPDGFVLIDDKFLLADDISLQAPQRNPKKGTSNFVRAIDGEEALLGPIPDNIEVIDDDCVLISSWIHQVGHFMFDTIPQCLLLDELRANKFVKDRPTLIYLPISEYSDDMVYFLYDSIFKPGDRKTILRTKFYRVRTLWVLRSPVDGRSRTASRRSFEYAKSKTNQIVSLHSANLDNYSKIYITRSDAKNNTDIRSRVINLNEIEDMLKGENFRFCELSKIPLSERIQIFSSAHMVCGIYGAGMLNSILMPTGSDIVCIHSPGADPSIGLFSEAAGHRYRPCPTLIEEINGESWMKIPTDYLHELINLSE